MAENSHTDETENRCPDSLPTKRVEDAEFLAYLVSHPKTCDENGFPTEGAFPFESINLRSSNTERYPHNRCGESEGLSLERTDLSRQGLIADESKKLAERAGAQEIEKGAAVSNTGQLRAVRLNTAKQSSRPGKFLITTDMQVAFVIADGKKGKERHSVLRFHPETDKVIHAMIREKVRATFVTFQTWTESAAS